MGHSGAGAQYDRKRVFTILIRFFLVIILVFAALIGYGIYWFFFDMDRLPKGEYLTEETSPGGEYTVKAYVNDGGATTAHAIRGELIFREKGNKAKNIYWNYREESAELVWKDDHTIVINGHVLDVRKDTYDFRRD